MLIEVSFTCGIISSLVFWVNEELFESFTVGRKTLNETFSARKYQNRPEEKGAPPRNSTVRVVLSYIQGLSSVHATIDSTTYTYGFGWWKLSSKIPGGGKKRGVAWQKK